MWALAVTQVRGDRLDQQVPKAFLGLPACVDPRGFKGCKVSLVL